jgi:hypothetical protein
MRKYFGLIIVTCLFLLASQSGISQNNNGKSGLKLVDSDKYHSAALGENVFLFDPGMDMARIQTLIDTLYNVQHERKSEFSVNRYALLFKPGTYPIDLKLGYYMQVIGLGKSPGDVVINGTLISRGLYNGNVTLNFWRSFENLTIQPKDDSPLIWGVSQAAPVRRVHIKGNIQLHDKGWASGGFLADSKVDGTIMSGPQQQWFSRNVDLGKWEGGNWNMMFVGVPNAPADKWPDNPYTVIKETPSVREKPYLVINDANFTVCMPKLKKNSAGVSWLNKADESEVLPFGGFYVAKPGIDNSESINAALEKGKNLFFTPGIYLIDKSLKIDRPGTVVMGIGLATLVPTNGNSIMEIADVNKVTVCGLIFDAGKNTSETLMRVGETNSGKNHSGQPTFLFDVFFRVGGPAEGSTKSCLIVNSNNVCIDHTWIWRADHGNGVAWDKNRCANGLIVNGDHVTIYGLFNEHFQEYQTLWNGDHGRLYFYQSELPYDPPKVESWQHDGIGGYASYKVSDKVKSHEAWGLGIYCVFYNAPVIVNNTIETPAKLEKDIHHKIIFWLNGNKESKILNVINDKGGSVSVSNRKVTMK